MTKEDKLALIADMLEIETDSINEETLLEDIEEWDSLNALNLIVLVDEHFGKTLTADVVNAFVSVGDILAAME